jgi:uncharacterized protein
MPRIPGTRVKDGRAINVSNGIMRASSRNSLEKLEPIEPGNADAYAFDSGATSNLFCCRAPNPGRSIQQQLFALRPQSQYRSSTGVGRRDDVARQTVLYRARYPSQIVLPVITNPIK